MDQKLINTRAIPCQTGTKLIERAAQIAPEPLHFPPSVISPTPQPLVGWQWSRECTRRAEDQKLIDTHPIPYQAKTTVIEYAIQISPKPLHIPPSAIWPLAQPLVGWQWSRD
jgi:hypothetical protein